jgi:hypothetical protein
MPGSVRSPRYDYVRSADPIGFWILIAFQAAVAAAFVVIGIAELLGLSTL